MVKRNTDGAVVVVVVVAAVATAVMVKRSGGINRARSARRQKQRVQFLEGC